MTDAMTPHPRDLRDVTDPRERLALLERLEAYYDLVPRSETVPEEVGPFTLFVSRGGAGAHSYYARPRLGLDRPVTASDVGAVLERQVALGVPRALEWVHETTPSLLPAAEAHGLVVEQCPLLVLVGVPRLPVGVAPVRVLAAADADLPDARAAVSVAFGHPGTGSGPGGVAERDAEVATGDAASARTAQDVASGASVVVAALQDGVGAVGGGTHRPRGATTEIVGVGVLPAYRRRGLAAAIAAVLAQQALDHGVQTVFCSAQDEDVARVYGGVGFRRVGTACLVEIADEAAAPPA